MVVKNVRVIHMIPCEYFREACEGKGIKENDRDKSLVTTSFTPCFFHACMHYLCCSRLGPISLLESIEVKYSHKHLLPLLQINNKDVAKWADGIEIPVSGQPFSFVTIF